MGTLAITFRGPFAFEIKKDKVNAYAPKCDNHHAAIFTANNEWPLCGRYRHGGDYVYEIVWAGITASAGTIKYPPVDSRLIWDPPPGFTFDAASAYKLPAGGGDMILHAPARTKIHKSEANFCITLPKPKAIYPVNPAPTEVVKNSTPKYNPEPLATGLRFYYEGDLNKPIYLIKPGKPSLTKPLSVENLPSLPGYADIDVRYAGPEADDAEHIDAMSCFDKTMRLVGLNWWLFYGQSETGAAIRTGADCKTVNIVVG